MTPFHICRNDTAPAHGIEQSSDWCQGFARRWYILATIFHPARKTIVSTFQYAISFAHSNVEIYPGADPLYKGKCGDSLVTLL
jgi:hypothetical protein